MLLPLVASAHEHDTFKIGNAHYQFVIGSLNEPIVVDDKTGLDLTVTKCYSAACTPTKSADGDMDGPAGTPVTGLENTLKVEMTAADQTKTFEINPQYGKPGAYKTTFYPTIATTFSYHITGTISDTPVDLTFTCVPEGTPRAEDDATAVKLSDSVTRTSHGGGFGCPAAKEALGFPVKASSINSLSDEAGNAKGMAQAVLAFGAVGLVLGVWSMRRKNS